MIISFPEHVILNIISYFEELESYFFFSRTCRTIKVILDQVRPLPKEIYLNYLESHPTGMVSFFNGLVSITFDAIEIRKSEDRRYKKRLTSVRCFLHQKSYTPEYLSGYRCEMIDNKKELTYASIEDDDYYILVLKKDIRGFDDESIFFEIEISATPIRYLHKYESMVVVYSFSVKEMMKFIEMHDESYVGYETTGFPS